MNKLILIAALFLGYHLWQKHQNSKPNPTAAAMATTDTCATKKLCTIVYVTPWCPACAQVSPILQAWISKTKDHPEYGIKVIVGYGRNAGDNERTAANYGVNSVVDSDLSLANKLNIKYYPTFLLVNPAGTIIKKDQDVVKWASETIL